VSAETPDRHGGGGHRRQYHQIRALLDAEVDVRVATLAGPQDDSSLRALAPVQRFGALRARGLLADPTLDRFLAEGRFAAAVVTHIESVPHVRRALARHRIPWLLDLHNVNSRWHRARGEWRATMTWRWRERSALRRAAAVTVCSREEREALLAGDPGSRVEVAAHGVDPVEWPAQALAQERSRALALFAAWGHGPNREGADWLAERVWPTVVRAQPQARLLLAGPGDPPPAILAQPRVEHVGRVDDLAGFLGGVRVVVVPIVNGIGARMKFVEALASGAAVVSTATGAEGFEADGAFARADGPDAFANACCELLGDARRAAALGRAGRALAFDRYDWQATTEPLIGFARRSAAGQAGR
jgi:glycosyltransferase involved in cell wall biosynthesis